MLQYAWERLESVFGKTKLGIIALLALGGTAVLAVPKVLVTPGDLTVQLEFAKKQLERSVDAVKAEYGKRIEDAGTTIAQAKKDNDHAQRALAVQVISLRIDLLRQQRRLLLAKPKLTPMEKADLAEIEEDISALRKQLAEKAAG